VNHDGPSVNEALAPSAAATSRRSSRGRLIVVSNRVMTPSTTHAGGLAQALNIALQRNGGCWIGWSGENSTRRDVDEVIEGSVRYLTFDIAAADFKHFYTDYSNRTLWPLLHGRADLMTFRADALHGYLKVNERFADVVAREATGDDVIWIHDYHLIPLASMLRARGVRCRIGFFLHVPVPASRLLATLPRHSALFGLLGAYDLVGVQTQADARALRSYLMAEAYAVEEADGRLRMPGAGALTLEAFPIGIDPAAMSTLAAEAEALVEIQELRESLSGRALIIGVDRLDYSKGLPQRLRAFGALMTVRPDLKGTATFLQVAPESRRDVREYRTLSHQIQRLVGDINGHHADPNWTPVRYVNKSYPHEVLAGFYRLAQVAAVTPLRDGMNLVAKEFLACQAESDPGVLVLSEFTGAAEQLDAAALIVNPYDAESCARAFARALTMPLEERQRRWSDGMRVITSHDIHRWCADYLSGLQDIDPVDEELPSPELRRAAGARARGEAVR
jgi:trehalose 6-phosphate synthase